MSISSLMDNLVFVQESGNCTTMDPFKIFKWCQTWMTQALGFKSNQRGREHCHCDTQPLLTELILSEGHWWCSETPNSWANNSDMLRLSKWTSLWMPTTERERECSRCVSELNRVKYVSSDVVLLLSVWSWRKCLSQLSVTTTWQKKRIPCFTSLCYNLHNDVRVSFSKEPGNYDFVQSERSRRT